MVLRNGKLHCICIPVEQQCLYLTMGDEVENLDVRSVSGKVIFKTPEGVNLYSVGQGLYPELKLLGTS